MYVSGLTSDGWIVRLENRSMSRLMLPTRHNPRFKVVVLVITLVPYDTETTNGNFRLVHPLGWKAVLYCKGERFTEVEAVEIHLLKHIRFVFGTGSVVDH